MAFKVPGEVPGKKAPKKKKSAPKFQAAPKSAGGFAVQAVPGMKAGGPARY